MNFFLTLIKNIVYIFAVFQFIYDNLKSFILSKTSKLKMFILSKSRPAEYEKKKKILDPFFLLLSIFLYYVISSSKSFFLIVKKASFGIRRRTNIITFNVLSKSPWAKRIINLYLEKLNSNNLFLEEYIYISHYAIEKNDNSLLKRCISALLIKFPTAIEDLRDFAIQLFIKGKYSDAKRVWKAVELYREQEIGRRSLDRLKVRILPLHWYIAVGHIAHLDSYFKNEIMNGNSSRSYIFDFPSSFEIPNPYLMDLWKSSIKIISGDRFNQTIDKEDRTLLLDDFWVSLDKSENALMFNEFGASVQERWKIFSGKAIVSIPEQDIVKGEYVLRKMGLPQRAWYVCLHVREQGFHQGWHNKNPGTRNANIDTYYDAIDLIISKGGFVIRLGDKSMRPLKAMPGVIDYPFTEFKSDFMDVFLCATCKFFIGTNSGLGLLSPIFNKPCLLTNWSPIAIPQWYPGDLMIPKLIKEINTGRYLSFMELLHSQAGWSQFENFFKKAKLEVIDNTSEEIKNAVMDMFAILEGRIENDSTHLVNQYSNIVLKNIGYIGSRVAPSFVKKYRDLLSDQDIGGDVHDQ